MDQIKRPTPQHFHETIFIGFLLSLVGGFLDSYTFLLMGGVFANAQTGNVVMLAVSLLDIKSLTFLKYLFPIFSFVLGVLGAEILKKKLQEGPRWALVVVFFEVLSLAIVGFIAKIVSDQDITCIISCIAGIQASSFKRIESSPFATTMITGNLRSGTELLVQAFLKKDVKLFRQSKVYFFIILSFILGALAGAGASILLKTNSIFICCFILIAAALWILKNRNKK